MRGDRNPMRRPEVREKVSRAQRGVARPYVSERVGDKNPAWKGGRSIHPEGYIRVLVDGQYVLEHRIVMEEHLGRELRKGEIVHHRNGDRADNRIENLELTNQSAHAAHHNRARRGQPVGDPPLCACGCGVPVLPSVRYPDRWNEYLHGHRRR